MDKIKPPCGYGDIIPIYVRGHWIYTSNCQDYRDVLDNITIGFTWFELCWIEVANQEYECPDLWQYQVHPLPSMDAIHTIRARWERRND